MRNRFIALKNVFGLLGSVLIVLGAFLLVPIAVALLGHEPVEEWLAFVAPSSIAIILGISLRSVFTVGKIDTVQSMLVCCLGWLAFSAIGALPFVMILPTSYLNGFFEAMSGFTTTGITMFSGLDTMPKSLLFWRSLTQWIGGLGILTFFLAVTYRGGGAHILFGAESHKIGTNRPVPGLINTLKILWAIYTGFTLLVSLSLIFAGMSLFDSVCHSFTALSTGGFSPYDASISHFAQAGYVHYRLIEYVLIIGMMLGGISFLVHYRILNRRWRALFDSTEMRYWWFFIFIFMVLIIIEKIIHAESIPSLLFLPELEKLFRGVLFQVVAILTTTGFSTQDIGGAFFGHFARQLFLIMMVIGGCVGSTGGGLKVLRVSILVKLIRRELFRIQSPRRAVARVVIDNQVIGRNELFRVSALFFAWIVLLVIGGGLTALLSHLESYEAFSGMFSALGNIGPCYISVETMGQLNPLIKIVYIIGMLAGRLEILPVLVLFSPRVWK